MPDLIEMLKYKRPAGSWSEKEFCQKYLEPVFGEPDEFGNYTRIIYEPVARGFVQPTICFTAHYDTVHRNPGMQQVVVTGDIVTVAQSDCLGADCTTGVWLILGMIASGVPGVYVVHAEEESGCKGSRSLVRDNPSWLQYVKAVISFDRRGQESIITHQMGVRTASDAFAVSLSDALGMPTLRPDPTGSYTDSNEYIDVVPECTNLSVGYLNQHTSAELQDLFFARQLLDKLCDADWSKLVIEREPGSGDFEYGTFYYRGSNKKETNYSQLLELIYEYPEEIAEVLDEWGCDSEYLYDQISAISFTKDTRRVG